jgi:hypothetical protein
VCRQREVNFGKQGKENNCLKIVSGKEMINLHTLKVGQGQRGVNFSRKGAGREWISSHMLKVGHGQGMNKFAHAQGGARGERSQL